VAYNEARLENLRAVVEEFGREGKNRMRARRIPAPAWFIVTSQERLDEVTSAIGDEKRVLIAKVRDRFRHEIDLSPADVREVASRRVLSKNETGERELSKLFEANEGQLNAACTLERTTRESQIDERAFIDFYPYPPHYIDLSINIMSGIRDQPGGMRHIGGSNRTIISQTPMRSFGSGPKSRSLKPSALTPIRRPTAWITSAGCSPTTPQKASRSWTSAASVSTWCS